MKNSLFIIVISLLLISCKSSEELVKTEIQKEVEVLCLASQCNENDPLSIFEFNGIGFTKIKELEKVGQDSFILRMPQGKPRFLYLGTEMQAKLPVIFSDEDMVIEGNCKAFRQSVINNSSYNAMYNEIIGEIQKSKGGMRVYAGKYHSAANSPDEQNKIKAEIAVFDQQRKDYLDTIQSQNAFLANVVALGTMASYSEKMTEYNNEVEYFIAEYFKKANLDNPEFNRIPYLFESFKEFSQVIASVGLDQNVVKDIIDKNMEMVPDSTQAMRYALGGVIIGLQAKKHPSFSEYASQFIEKFGANTDAVSLDRLKDQMEQAKSFVPGGSAPEIEMETPEGKMMKLSELRGKVVLIDFWASWCGPCRKENPNVVRVYEKYKSEGFEILGVSLDQTKEKWEAAIAKDGLTWHHVSDLKGWQNEAAQSFGVRSIPDTVLLDKEGKIIARNLRGSALEQKLDQIFK